MPAKKKRKPAGKSGPKSAGPKSARTKQLAGFYGVIADLALWSAYAQTPFVVVGGVAAIVYGGARPTHDIDLISDLAARDWGKFLKSGERFGFFARPEHDAKFAQRTRVLLLEHRKSGVPIDMSVAGSGIETGFFERAMKPKDEMFKLPAISAEDLIVMKALAQRDQDARDINAVLDTMPRLDIKRVREFVKAIGEQIDRPELVEWLDNLLASR